MPISEIKAKITILLTPAFILAILRAWDNARSPFVAGLRGGSRFAEVKR